ncbi:hypothetical protein [Roseococcus microcysteis]|uniref:hypothetical protein n=1 Tax=Roseococcus microcysteis TaxID=2771361 RepID=UPI00168AACD7|nr:hypothetical protein [Roseococcus microcysteis]
MTDRSDFVRDPVEFMGRHIVRCQFFDWNNTVDISQSRAHVITIKEMQGPPMVLNRPGAKVFYLSNDVAGCARNEMLPIFWLGYRQNKVTQGTLNNQSRVMFTANMDGCSLGVGSQAGDGGCLVMHANKARGMPSGEAQALAQHGQLQRKFDGQEFHVVEPSTYLTNEADPGRFLATNFGINRDGWWFFYTHSWRLKSGGMDGFYLHGGTREAIFTLG